MGYYDDFKPRKKKKPVSKKTWYMLEDSTDCFEDTEANAIQEAKTEAAEREGDVRLFRLIGTATPVRTEATYTPVGKKTTKKK